MDDAKMREKVEEMKSKAKAFMKNFSSPFGSTSRAGGSSSQAFQGQGHKLGGSSEPSPSNGGGAWRRVGPAFNEQRQQQDEVRRQQQERWARARGVVPAQTSCQLSSGNLRKTEVAHVIQSGGTLASAAASVKSPAPNDRIRVERESRGTVQVGNMPPPTYSFGSGRELLAHFDPCSSVIAAGTSHLPAIAVNGIEKPPDQFQCPICQKWWESEAQVSAHIDDCTGGAHSELAGLSIEQEVNGGGHRRQRKQESHVVEDLDDAVAIFLSGGPSKATIQIIQRVFGNILKCPNEEKYRMLRLGKDIFKETIGSAIGGLKFCESVGFRLVVDGQEKSLIMEQPNIEKQERIQAAIAYLDSYDSATMTLAVVSSSRTQPAKQIADIFDRQLRIFYTSIDRAEARFAVPDSFYNVSAIELKNEAAARRKKLEESQMLIPKSWKEKQAAIAKKRYKATIIRVQLPDGLLVQGLFKPGEPTSSLYEFVASTLKDTLETFDLVLPAATSHRVIPRGPDANGHCLTMEEVDLVPKALLMLNPTGPLGYTCLKSECYEVCEPLQP